MSVLIKTPATKTCGGCGLIAEFYRSGGRLCKACVRAASRLWYQANTVRAKGSIRSWKAAHPAAVRASNERWRSKNPEKRVSQRAVSTAVTRGELVREPCLFCGDRVVDAHHHNYALPLAVTWLCRDHHALAHKKIAS